MSSVIFFTLASALLGLAASESSRVIDANFADPCVVQTSDGYYAFATSGNGVNVQVASSSDFSTWNLMSGTDALPGPFPSWVASSPAIWAPDVIQRVRQNTHDQIR
jgi:beta-xylosidase